MCLKCIDNHILMICGTVINVVLPTCMGGDEMCWEERLGERREEDKTGEKRWGQKKQDEGERRVQDWREIVGTEKSENLRQFVWAQVNPLFFLFYRLCHKLKWMWPQFRIINRQYDVFYFVKVAMVGLAMFVSVCEVGIVSLFFFLFFLLAVLL